MAKLFSKSRLPHLHSTRDTRDRLDLITDNVPVNAKFIRADRIIYHPGDTAARHYHTDCHHLFYALHGNGILHVDEGSHQLSPPLPLSQRFLSGEGEGGGRGEAGVLI